MKNLLVSVIFFLGLICSTNAQDSTYFTRILDAGRYHNTTSPQAIIQTQDSSFVICGPYADQYGVIVKVDNRDSVLWNSYVDISGKGTFTDIIELSDGSMIAGGYTYASSSYNTLLSKISSNGNVLWSKQFNSSGNTSCHKLVLGDNNDFFITGIGPIIAKFDSSGTVIWAKDYDIVVSALDINRTIDNGLIMIGAANNTGTMDAFVAKIDSLGDIVWSKIYGQAGYDRGILVEPLPDGTFIISGNLNTNTGNGDTFFSKLSSTGNQIWTRTLFADGEMDPMEMITTLDSNLIMVSRNNQSTWNSSLMKVNTFGDLLWLKSFDFGVNEICTDIIELDSGQLVISGMVDPFTNNTKYLAQLSPNGDIGCNNVNYIIDSITNNLLLESPTTSMATAITLNLFSVYSTTTFPLTTSLECICPIVPPLTISADRCINDTNIYFYTDADTNMNYNFMWSLNNGYNSSTSTVSYPEDSLQTGFPLLFLEATDSIGCATVANMNYLTYSTIADTFSFTSSGFNASFHYQDSLTTIFWDFGDGYISSNINPTHSYLIDGTYEVCLFANFCDTTILCDSITIDCNAGSASYSYLDNGNGNYSFTNTSIGNYNKTHWAFGDGNTSITTNANHTFSANGTFIIVLTINDSIATGNCIDYYLDTITVTGVTSPAQCVSGFVMHPDTTNNDITVVNSSTGTNLTYLWDFGDGNTSTLQNPSHTYATAGHFHLCLTVDDGTGCVDMYCDSIGENGVVFKTGGFTINVIGTPIIAELDNYPELNSDINIYPNPTSNKLTIDTEVKFSEISIIDITSKIIMTTKGNTKVLNVIDLSDGIYFIQLITEDRTITKKFVKQ